ncbi:hypothetical protein ACROYT_G021992 [Oculina patagonica]
MTRKTWFDTLCLLLCVIIQARVSKGKDLYISRASGNDNWSCDQIKPCKTIWRAVTLASRGDHIHLDGNNTEEDPYTCQSRTSLHPGININKSLSLIGFGPIPPHIQCSEGTNLTFDGTDNTEQMEINLSGLFLNDSFVYFQDSYVNINSCTFEGSKRGVQFLLTTRMVSTIQITNSTFRENSECISVVANSSTSQSQIIQVIFKLINSSFYGNSMSENGSFISFTESPEKNQSVSCNITLDNVTFSHNKFSSKGLVFLDLKNGNQNIDLQNVTFTNNNPLSGRDVLAGDSYSECIVRSNLVNIIINASNFTSQNARLFNANTSKVSLQIYKSNFRGHKVEGHGGVISMGGTDLCKLNVSNSSFFNTTAALGGAINMECTKLVRVSFQENIFTGNTARNSGGAVFIGVFAPGSTNPENTINEKVESNNNRQSGKLLHSYTSKGGSIDIYGASRRTGNVAALKASAHAPHSTLTDRASFEQGEEYQSRDSFSDTEDRNISDIDLLLVINNVLMDSNNARAFGGAATIYPISTVRIRNSRFLTNNAEDVGGVFNMIEINILEVVDSLFDSNYVTDQWGGAFLIQASLTFKSILIINTTFTNCSAASGGGALFLEQEGNLSLVIKQSRFVKNRSFKYPGVGGALYISLARDENNDPGCNRETSTSGSESNEAKKYPSWNYKSYVVIEDTTFGENAARLGGAVYLNNGKTIFHNCYFADNFAALQGGHIYTLAGSASVIVQDSLFLQTRKDLHFNKVIYYKASFIHAESSGTLNISNTTMDARPYGGANPLMVVANGGLVDVGSDNLTQFYCPVGSDMKIVHFTEQVMTQVNNTSCKMEVTALEFSCSTCKGNYYSLQRGHSLGSQLVPGFQCLPCPFGANCTQNIVAKLNFWGFKEQITEINAQTLRFTICPVGYCSSPQETAFPEYNGCQGNRSGELCGHCIEGYTETLNSTHCKPSHQCNDYWFWPVALAYVSLMALYVTFKPPIMPLITRQILWFKEHKPENNDNNFDKGYLKILFYFYQAANLLVVSSSSQYLIKANLIEPIVGLFNFKLLPSRLICPFPGLTVVTKQLFSASHVFGTLLMICVFYILRWGIQKIRGKGVPSVGPYVGGILQTLLLGYTTLATVSFSLLRCVPIGSERRLFYDGNVVCFQWWQYILIAFVCTFVLPFVFVFVWGSYKLYDETLSVGKFLLACFFSLPSLIYWLFIFFSRVLGYPDPVNGHSTPSQVSRSSVERVLYDSFKRPDDGGKLSLIWEIIMIGRRLILVLIKSFVSDPLPRLLIMSLLCFLFLLHHVVAQPFRDSIANVVEAISLLSVAVLAIGNVFFASFLSLAVPLNNHFSLWWNVLQGVENVILCFVPAVFGILVVTAILSQLCRIAVWVGNVCWTCCRSCYNNQDEEANPLLAPVD